MIRVHRRPGTAERPLPRHYETDTELMMGYEWGHEIDRSMTPLRLGNGGGDGMKRNPCSTGH